MKRTLALAALAVLALTACGADHPGEHCVAGHIESGVRPYVATGVGPGGTVVTHVIVAPYSEYVCDRWVKDRKKK